MSAGKLLFDHLVGVPAVFDVLEERVRSFVLAALPRGFAEAFVKVTCKFADAVSVLFDVNDACAITRVHAAPTSSEAAPDVPFTFVFCLSLLLS
jgi:hypothetical protein